MPATQYCSPMEMQLIWDRWVAFTWDWEQESIATYSGGRIVQSIFFVQLTHLTDFICWISAMTILDMEWALGNLQRKIFMQMLMLPGMHWEPDMGYHQKMWFCTAKVLVQFQLLTWRLGKKKN